MINESFALHYGEDEIKAVTGGFLFVMNDSYYQQKAAEDAIKAQFGAISLTSLGLAGRELCVLSLGALLAYLLETQKQNLKQLTRCQFYEIGKHMSLDKATLRNLEITETLYDKKNTRLLAGCF